MNIMEFRQLYPEYNHIGDKDLADKISKKFGSFDNVPIPDGAASQSKDNQTRIPYQAPGALAAGILSGASDLSRGLGQTARAIGEKAGLLSPGSADRYTQEANLGRGIEQAITKGMYPAGQQEVAAGQLIGGAAPVAGIPGGAGLGLLKRMGIGGATGAGIGGSQYIPAADQAESFLGMSPDRAQNTIIGGLLGGAAPGILQAGSALTKPVSSVVKKFGKILFPKQSETEIAKDILTGIDVKKALKTKKAGEELGLTLTPGQASGSEQVISAEGALGRSRDTAGRRSEFSRKQSEAQKKAVNDILKNLSPSRAGSQREIRGAAKKIVQDKIDARKKMSEPFYEDMKKDKIPAKEMYEMLQDNSLINDSLNAALKDKAYASKMTKLDNTSVEYWDYVKRKIDDSIRNLSSKGKKNEARIYAEAKEKLIEITDKNSPSYKTARSLYEDGSRNIDKLKEADIVKIAELPDNKLKDISKIIFDRNETGAKSMASLRNEFSKESPDAWRKLIRTEWERRLDAVKGERTGSKFYDTILAKDADFKQFIAATKGMPDVQKKLINMRRAFSNLTDVIRNKDIISKEGAIQGITREVGKEASKFISSGYDNAAIDLITSGKWDKQLGDIMKIKNKVKQTDKMLSLLERVNKSLISTTTRPSRED